MPRRRRSLISALSTLFAGRGRACGGTREISWALGRRSVKRAVYVVSLYINEFYISVKDKRACRLVSLTKQTKTYRAS